MVDTRGSSALLLPSLMAVAGALWANPMRSAAGAMWLWWQFCDQVPSRKQDDDETRRTFGGWLGRRKKREDEVQELELTNERGDRCGKVLRQGSWRVDQYALFEKTRRKDGEPRAVRFRHEASDEDGDVSSAADDFGGFVFECDSPRRCVAHGTHREFVGCTLAEILARRGVDVDADQLHARFCRAACSKDGGWVNYEWRNSAGPRLKGAYVVELKKEGRSVFAGFGYCVSREQPPPRPPPPKKKCEETMSRELRALLGRSLRRASIQEGPSMAIRALVGRSLARSIDHAPVGFAYDPATSVCVAHGTPKLVGMTLTDITEWARNPGLDVEGFLEDMRDAAQDGGGWIKGDYLWRDSPLEPLRWKRAFVVQTTHEGRSLVCGYAVLSSQREETHPPLSRSLARAATLDLRTELQRTSSSASSVLPVQEILDESQALSGPTVAKALLHQLRDHTIRHLYNGTTAPSP